MTAASLPAAIGSALPNSLPDTDAQRLALLAIRRLGAHGLDDAGCVQAYVGAFGQGFRRPLTLMRCFLAEVASSATGPIAIAPCCCPRATADESTLVDALALALHRPQTARLLLADLLGVRRPDSVVSSAAAVASAFADLGKPISA
jgi:hypothetical protein